MFSRTNKLLTSSANSQAAYLRKKNSLRLILIAICFLSTPLRAQVNVNYIVFQGKQALMQEDFTEAVRLFNVAITSRNDLHEPYFFRAIAKYNLGDLKGAERDLTEAISIKPNYPEALMYRGVCRERLMNLNDAISDFDRALKLDAFNDEIIVSKAFTLTLQGHYREAIELCNNAIKINRKNERAFLCRAWSRYQLYDFEGSADDYSSALSINRFNAETHVKRAMVKSFQLKYDEATSDLHRALELDSLNLSAMYQLAAVHRELDEPDKALALYSRMIQTDPSNAIAYYERGLMLSDDGLTDEAIEDFTMVNVLTGGHLLAYFNRGGLYFEKGKYSAAVEDLSKAIEIYPGLAEAYHNRAMAYAKMGLVRKAESDYEKARSIKSELYSLNPLEQQQELKKIQDVSRIGDGFSQNPDNQSAAKLIRTAPDYFVVPDNWVPDSLRSAVMRFAPLEKFAAHSEKLVAIAHPGWTPDQSDQLRAMLNEQLSENPDDAGALLYQGILFQLLENYDLALEIYTLLIASDREHHVAVLNRSYVLHRMQLLSGAFESSLAGLSSTPESSAQIDNHYRSIADDLEKITFINPGFVPAAYNLGNLYASMGNYHEAAEAYRLVLERTPQLTEAHFNLGLTLLYLNNAEEACTHLSIAGENGYNLAWTVIKRYCK